MGVYKERPNAKKTKTSAKNQMQHNNWDSASKQEAESQRLFRLSNGHQMSMAQYCEELEKDKREARDYNPDTNVQAWLGWAKYGKRETK